MIDTYLICVFYQNLLERRN